jgi:hypothetical protein
LLGRRGKVALMHNTDDAYVRSYVVRCRMTNKEISQLGLSDASTRWLGLGISKTVHCTVFVRTGGKKERTQQWQGLTILSESQRDSTTV